jgi:hypothetical protein
MSRPLSCLAGSWAPSASGLPSSEPATSGRTDDLGQIKGRAAWCSKASDRGGTARSNSRSTAICCRAQSSGNNVGPRRRLPRRDHDREQPIECVGGPDGRQRDTHLGFVIERRPDVTVKRCMAARPTALAILFDGFPIVLEMDGCGPWPGRRFPLEHGRELMDVIGPAAQEREYGQAGILKRWQSDQGFTLIVRVNRLNEPLAQPTVVTPRKPTLDRFRAVPAIRQREQSAAYQRHQIRRYGPDPTMLFVQCAPHHQGCSSNAAQ